MTKPNNERMEFTAPDGGWGWMVVIGAGISNMVLLSILQTFGLLHKDRFQELEFSHSDITTLMSFNSSFGLIMGILNGPLLKIFGYRKIAILGGVLKVSALYYTAFAESYIEYLISYGAIASLGLTMSMSSFSLALNTYFRMKRSTASSLSITIMGLGTIILPLLITQLLTSYGSKWTILILAAYTMNTFVGALLLQPIKWHLHNRNEMKLENETIDSVPEKAQKQENDSHSIIGYGPTFLDPTDILGSSQLDISENLWRSQSSLHIMKSSHKELPKTQLNEGNDKGKRKLQSITSLDNEDYGDMMKSTLHVLNSSAPKVPIKYASMETLGNRSCNGIYESQKLLNKSWGTNYMSYIKIPSDEMSRENVVSEKDTDVKRRNFVLNAVHYIKSIYDVDLLFDPIYVNLLFGLSIATVGEIIFSILTPFIMSDLGLNMDDTAKFMSVVAITDVIFRFLCPYVGNQLKFNSRVMYIISITVLLLSRASLFLASSLNGFLIIGFLLGMGKGFRTVHWTLVIPDYVPLYKLASANAFQSLCNGISLLISGPIIGLIVSNSMGGYTNVIHASNVLTLTTIVMWSTEFLIVHHRSRNQQRGA